MEGKNVIKITAYIFISLIKISQCNSITFLLL